MKKCLICDLDGSLVSFPLFGLNGYIERFALEVFPRLPLYIQRILVKPTFWLGEVKCRQSQGVKIFILTARERGPASCKKVKLLLKKVGLDVNESDIIMRPRGMRPREFKYMMACKISKKYKVVGILEDEKEHYKKLKKYGRFLE